MINEETITEIDRYFDENPDVVKNEMKNKADMYASTLLEDGDDIIKELTYEPNWFERLKYRLKKVFG